MGSVAGEYRLLAIDVDGTLLAADGHLRESTRAAVFRAASAGIRPVLCTGRRYRRARAIAEELGLDAPLVCNSGSLVKDPATDATLWRADLSPETLADVLDQFEASAHPVLAFCDEPPDRPDYWIAAYPTGRRLFDEYVRLNREHAGIDPRGRARLEEHTTARFHLCTIGTRSEMLSFEGQLARALPGRIRTFVQRSPRYEGTMCEVLDAPASKWSAVLHLASGWGIEAAQICAVGDDVNDVPMIRGAGLGVAMGHAPSVVLEAADLVTDDHEADGLARFIDGVLLNGRAN